jgi:sugar-phosphatase
MCRAILFDLDGVLVDSRAVVERTWQRWAAARGFPSVDLARRAHGRRSIDTVQEFAPDLDPDEEVRWLAAAELADTEGLAQLPGALVALAALTDDERAVVTSGGGALATLRLTHTGLPVPRVLVAAEDVMSGKPDPEGYLAAARRLQVDPRDCVVFEDAPPGVEAGLAAGATVIAVSTTFPVDALHTASAVVESMAAVHLSRSGEEVVVSLT